LKVISMEAKYMFLAIGMEVKHTHYYLQSVLGNCFF